MSSTDDAVAFVTPIATELGNIASRHITAGYYSDADGDYLCNAVQMLCERVLSLADPTAAIEPYTEDILLSQVIISALASAWDELAPLRGTLSTNSEILAAFEKVADILDATMSIAISTSAKRGEEAAA